MAMAETAQLIVDLRLNDRLSGKVKGAQRSLSGLSGTAAKTQGALSRIGQGFKFGAGFFIAQKVMSALPNVINDAVKSLDELQSVEAQTAAAIGSTGGAAGVTAKQIRDLSVALEDKTTIDDKVIQRGANLLLTFTSIQNRVGKGNDIFNRATTAVLDMSTALGQDVKQSAIQLGKALQDPIKGVTALRRVGVAFTAEQIEQIKKLVGTGNALNDLKLAGVEMTKAQKAQIKALGASVPALEAAALAGVKLDKSQVQMLTTMKNGSGLLAAQKLILREINTEFGTSATAQSKTYAGQIRRLGDAFEDLKLAGIKAALPGLTTVVTNLATTFRDPAFLKGAQDFGKAIGDFGTKENFDGIKAFVSETLPPLVEGLKLAGQATRTVVDIFRSLPPELQKAVILGVVANKISGGLVGSAIGGVVKGGVGAAAGAIGGLLGRGGTPATPLYTKDVGLAGVGGAGGVAGGTSKLGKVVGAIGIIGSIAAPIVAAVEIGNQSTAQANGIQQQQLDWFKTQPSLAELSTGLAAIDTGIAELRSNPLNVLVQGDALTKLEEMRAALIAQVGLINAIAAGKQTIDFIAGERAQLPTRPGTAAPGTNIGGGMLPGAPGRPKAKPLPGVTPAKKPPTTAGGLYIPTQVNVNVSTDHRQNSSAAAITNRYGPTPAEAGSR